MSVTQTTQDLAALLEASRATEPFKEAVRALADNRAQNLIRGGSSPTVKMLRLTMKLLEERPDLPLESLDIDAVSGCSNYTGTAVAQPDNVRIDFNWDCKWKAIEQGWKDAFGDPDQVRAARTFGYQCFEKFVVN